MQWSVEFLSQETGVNFKRDTPVCRPADTAHTSSEGPNREQSCFFHYGVETAARRHMGGVDGARLYPEKCDTSRLSAFGKNPFQQLNPGSS